MQVYLVSEDGPGYSFVLSAHKTFDGALLAWNSRREELLANDPENRNLRCTDPEKLDNFPNATPYIEEYQLVE